MLAETSTDLICVLAPSGALRYASPACRELLGEEPEDLLGRAFTDLVHPDDAAGVAAVLSTPGDDERRSRSPIACAAPAGCPCGSRPACAWCATRPRAP